MKIAFKKIVLLTTLLTIAPAHTKQIGRATVQPTRPTQPVIPVLPAPVQPAPVKPVIVQPQPVLVQPVQQPFPARTNTWTSSAGLVYKSNKNLSNRINHVLAHAKADPTKQTHSVFNMPENRILDVVDEAWSNRGNPEANMKADTYIIEMGRNIGTKGETRIMIVVSAGTSDLITAYPVQ